MLDLIDNNNLILLNGHAFSNITGDEEKPWCCEKIKREMSIRKKYNRERRNAPVKCKQEVLGRNYQEQKYKTQRIIKE